MPGHLVLGQDAERGSPWPQRREPDFFTGLPVLTQTAVLVARRSSLHRAFLAVAVCTTRSTTPPPGILMAPL
jgi:hypothetical protein